MHQPNNSSTLHPLATLRSIIKIFIICILTLPTLSACATTPPTPQSPPTLTPSTPPASNPQSAIQNPKSTNTPIPIPPTPTPQPTATATPLPTCPTPDENWGAWCYDTNLFVHPIASALHEPTNTLFLLDGGRVLALNQTSPTAPQTILQPGDTISNTRVIEPLDLTLTADTLLTLDRAGDVYRYDLQTQKWALDRYDRPIRDLSSHYFIALATAGENRYLIETSYDYGLRYQTDDTEAGWPLPDHYLIDLAVTRTDDVSTAYLLSQPKDSSTDTLTRFRAGQIDDTYQPQLDIKNSWQLTLTPTALWILDQTGRRLTALSPTTGRRLNQLTLPTSISTFTVSADGSQLILIGRNAIYYVNQLYKNAVITGGDPFPGIPPHDPNILTQIGPLRIPTTGASIDERDLRLPGAPRHYRLGVHQGFDIYWSPGKPVLAVAAGTVIRAETDYTPPTEQQFADMREEARTLGYTPENVLDFYRGRQIWIAHENGLISRYAHLSAITDGLEVGTAVNAGDIIGEVGNSGSPASQESPTADSHLHFELWLSGTESTSQLGANSTGGLGAEGTGHYIGQFLRPIETRWWLKQIFE